ncbi:MAG: hypothetical protein ACRDGQ_11795, partial [Candidatus Limnocylindrales bacterium]
MRAGAPAESSRDSRWRCPATDPAAGHQGGNGAYEALGATDGAALGALDGAALGALDGATLGAADGEPAGATEGATDGATLGTGVDDGEQAAIPAASAADRAMVAITRFIRFLHDEVGLQELAGNGSSRIVRGPPELVLNARLPET